MNLLEEAKKHYSEQIYSITADLHAHPELSFEEKRTSAIIRAQLEKLGIEILDLGLETGVVGLLRGRGDATIALRADIDAIVQHEEYDRPDKSLTPGVMHGCGHDTHTAGLLGAAMLLSAHRDELRANVLFVFQPAEEKLKGAKYMLEHNVFSQYKPSAVFGLHNLPELPVGTVGVKAGPLMSFKDGFRIKFIGKSGHTSTPQKNVDPTVAIASLVMSLETIISRNVGPLESAVLTVCSIQSGTPFTTTIDDAEITGNIRSLEEDVRERILKREARPLFDRRAADDEHKFPARPLGAVFFKRCADRRADDLLVQLRELAPERNVPVAEHIVKIAERFRELVRRFVEDHRARLAAQALKMLAPGLAAHGEEALEAKLLRRQAGNGQRRDGRARAGDDLHVDALLGALAHDVLTGVGDGGHAGVGHERARLTGEQPGDDLLTAGVFVVLIVAHARFFDLKMVEELRRHARVLGGDEVGAAQRLECTHGQVAEVADRRADQRETAACCVFHTILRIIYVFLYFP